MQRTAKTYFKPDGSYHGTMIIFLPETENGESLHADGISIVRPDGSVFQQLNPYTTKERHTKLGLVEVAGEYGGEQRLRGGRVENIPDSEKPAPPKTAERRIAELEAISQTLEARLAAIESRVSAPAHAEGG